MPIPQANSILKSNLRISFSSNFRFLSFHTAWVISAILTAARSLPVFPYQQTCDCTALTDAMCHKRSSVLMEPIQLMLNPCRGVVTSYKAIVTAHGSPDLMQASRGRTISAVSIAHEMLKLQNDPLWVIEIASEGM